MMEEFLFGTLSNLHEIGFDLFEALSNRMKASTGHWALAERIEKVGVHWILGPGEAPDWGGGTAYEKLIKALWGREVHVDDFFLVAPTSEFGVIESPQYGSHVCVTHHRVFLGRVLPEYSKIFLEACPKDRSVDAIEEKQWIKRIIRRLAGLLAKLRQQSAPKVRAEPIYKRLCRITTSSRLSPEAPSFNQPYFLRPVWLKKEKCCELERRRRYRGYRSPPTRGMHDSGRPQDRLSSGVRTATTMVG